MQFCGTFWTRSRAGLRRPGGRGCSWPPSASSYLLTYDSNRGVWRLPAVFTIVLSTLTPRPRGPQVPWLVSTIYTIDTAHGDWRAGVTESHAAEWQQHGKNAASKPRGTKAQKGAAAGKESVLSQILS